MSIQSILAKKETAYFTKGIAGAVIATTAIKAISRPAFVYADKKLDPETKKYTAGKEFLYQLLCLGLTFAMIMPAEKIGYALAKKHLTTDLASKFKDLKAFKAVTKDLDELTKEAKAILGKDKVDDAEKSVLKLVKGGVELGSFVGSILGLTIVAPLISHQILHPVMKALGMEKKHDSIGKPAEIFLADAKVPSENKTIANA